MIPRELALEADIQPVGRLQGFDATVNVLGRERRFDFALDVTVRQRPAEVPLRIEALGIDLAEREVIGEPEQGLGVQDIVLRAQDAA